MSVFSLNKVGFVDIIHAKDKLHLLSELWNLYDIQKLWLLKT